MPKILHLMRHGQGFHSEEVNPGIGPSIPDPQLTDKGKMQCRARCEAFERHADIELLLASPLRRAIQTCQLSFAPVVARGQRIIALPHAEEVSANPSDTGSDAAVLRAEFGPGVDFDHLRHGWERHEGEFGTDPASVTVRAATLRHWIRARPEKEIALVSHGFFNHFVTGEVDERGEQTTPWWSEAELRTYVFVEEGEPGYEVAMVRETEESRRGRGLPT